MFEVASSEDLRTLCPFCVSSKRAFIINAIHSCRSVLATSTKRRWQNKASEQAEASGNDNFHDMEDDYILHTTAVTSIPKICIRDQ